MNLVFSVRQAFTSINTGKFRRSHAPHVDATPSLVPRELRLALFSKGPDAFGVVFTVVDDAPQSLDALKASGAHWMSTGEHA